MARIKQITEKNEVSAENEEIFDSIASSRGRISGPFSVLLHSPEIAGRAAHHPADAIAPAPHPAIAVLVRRIVLADPCTAIGRAAVLCLALVTEAVATLGFTDPAGKRAVTLPVGVVGVAEVRVILHHGAGAWVLDTGLWIAVTHVAGDGAVGVGVLVAAL